VIRTGHRRFRLCLCPRPYGALPYGATLSQTRGSSSGQVWLRRDYARALSWRGLPLGPLPLAACSFVRPMSLPTTPGRGRVRHHRRGQRVCAAVAVMRSAFHCWIARTRPSHYCEATAWRRRYRSRCPSAFGVLSYPKDRWLRDRPGSRNPMFDLFWNVCQARLVLEGGAT